ncbi:MAG: hypothetical protein J1E07_06830 [Treponema sp.]|nr:hypothetical protein [Treponema sp.]
MKKISVILGALALGCVAMLTSCKNGAQDVNVVNWDSMYDGFDYIGDVAVSASWGDDLKDANPKFKTTSASYGKVKVSSSLVDTNYTTYNLTLEGLDFECDNSYIPNLANELKYINITKIDGKDGYVCLGYEGEQTVTVDGDLDGSEFTVTVSFIKDKSSVYDYVKSFTVKFTRR